MLSLEVNPEPKKGKKILAGKDTSRLIIGVLAVLLVVALGGMVYLYSQYVVAEKTPTKSEEELIREAVGSKILLPDEIPQIATVTDKGKLADQPFFRRAENGDKILIFTNSGRAVLYRPKIKKVIDTTTISLTPEETGAGTVSGVPSNASDTMTTNENLSGEGITAEPDERLNIAIYNGSQKVGITNSFDDELKGMYKNIDVVLKETAKKSDYQKSLVVDLTERNTPFAKELASKINGEVGSLPEGEGAPENTDVLIILGNIDYRVAP